jgi:Raf kinase inhibitor-like YbhB/YbcL family protein
MSEQQRHPDHSGESLTIMRVEAVNDVPITLTSPAQQADGRLADPYSAYHDNISPPLQWSNVPDVKAWAIVVEDPDAPQDLPFIHWMAWNIEGGLTTLPQAIPATPRPVTPQAMIQGRNGRGGYGWFGPRPPAGHGVHRYYFQIFALSDFIPMDEDTPLNELLNALKALTLAKGEMMATYEAPTRQ